MSRPRHEVVIILVCILLAVANGLVFMNASTGCGSVVALAWVSFVIRPQWCLCLYRVLSRALSMGMRMLPISVDGESARPSNRMNGGCLFVLLKQVPLGRDLLPGNVMPKMCWQLIKAVGMMLLTLMVGSADSSEIGDSNELQVNRRWVGDAICFRFCVVFVLIFRRLLLVFGLE